MKHGTFKKALVGSICAVLIVAGSYAPNMPTTPKAHAFLGAAIVSVVGDIPSTLERVLDGIGWMAAKTVVNSLTQSIVNWINSGFEGSPAFTTDLNRNLSNLGDSIAEDFIRGLDDVVQSSTGFSIRAPFQDQIASALREEFYRTTSSYGFDMRFPYRNCYSNGEFTLDGFYYQSQNDGNNAYGRYETARNELFRELEKETQTRIRELDWGNGFLSWRGTCGPYGRTSELARTGSPTPLPGDGAPSQTSIQVVALASASGTLIGPEDIHPSDRARYSSFRNSCLAGGRGR